MALLTGLYRTIFTLVGLHMATFTLEIFILVCMRLTSPEDAFGRLASLFGTVINGWSVGGCNHYKMYGIISSRDQQVLSGTTFTLGSLYDIMFTQVGLNGSFYTGIPEYRTE